MTINELLGQVVSSKASDLHLSAGMPAMVRLNGEMGALPGPALSHQEVHALVTSLMTEAQRKQFEAELEADFSTSVEGTGRFRVNAFVQHRGAGAVMRAIPERVLSLDQLKAPKVLREVASAHRGLVLVTGPTGSGKSTTLAAMIDHVNETEQAHILTIEDPIEFVHQSKKSLINQREVGPHTRSFANALRAALREDPDVILVGEMRDLETIRLALTAAETGHLVFGTLHTTSAAKTIDRVIDVFPAGEKEMVRAMLSESLNAVIAQTLVKAREGGRAAAHEIMIGTPAIRNLIREGKIALMNQQMQTGQAAGMQTLDQGLLDLYKRGVISADEAKAYASNKELIKPQ